jgi:sulfite exporter TauE/SafE
VTVALAGTILTASLVGSLHCAGMCGGFVAVWAGGPTRRARVAAHAAYHLARLFTYAALGAIAGGLGAAVDVAGAVTGAGRLAAIVAGASMVASGSVALARALGARVPLPALPPAIARIASRACASASERPPIGRAFVLGAASGLLPCGWLYAFVLLAAGTGRPGTGALVMIAFWAGTVPMLVGLGAAVAALAAPVRRRLPAVTAALLIAVGLLWLAGRAGMPAPLPARSAGHECPSHDSR